MVRTYRAILEFPIKFNKAIVCGVCWAGKIQCVSDQDSWMLRSDVYIFQKTGYTQDKECHHMNEYCHIVNVTDTDVAQ